MNEAHSFQSIISKMKVDFSLPIIINKRVLNLSDMIGSTRTFGLMVTSENKPLKTQMVKTKVELKSKIIGILFCSPHSELGKKEIVNYLPYFHHRSDTTCDFYCVGYGASWPADHYADQAPVANIDGINWFFSAKAFNNIRKEIEGECEWLYSGETELILLAAKKMGEEVGLDFNTAIKCNLEEMKKDEAFDSVRNFFEKLFRFAESYAGEKPVWDFSDKEGLSQGRNFLVDAVLSLLPKTVKKRYKAAKHFAVSNLSKKP